MTKPKTAGPEHEAFYQEFAALLKKHAGDLDAIVMLAIASNAVGKMIALQDQRKYTGPQIMEIVAKNIEEGNQQVLRGLSNTKGSA